MSNLVFRNLDVDPSAPVEDWPYEGLIAAIERGYLSDWRRIARAIDASPWGEVSRRIEDYAEYGEERAVAKLLLTRTHLARQGAKDQDEQSVTARVRAAIDRSGVPAKVLASECGTSAARMSTYRTGKVQPSAAMLARIERVADRLSAAVTEHGAGSVGS